MSPAPTTRNSRRKEIPENFILNWHCPGAQGSKPVIRRPLTACDACRAAKVKCNGKLECERCSSRGEVCRYLQQNGDQTLQKSTSTDSVTSSKRKSTKTPKKKSRLSSSISCAKRQSSIQNEAGSSSKQGTSNELVMDLLEPCQMESLIKFPHTHPNDRVLHWPTEMVNPMLDDFNWEALIGINQSSLLLSSPIVESNPIGFNLLQSLAEDDGSSYMESIPTPSLTHSYSESLGSTPEIERTSFLSLDGQQSGCLPFPNPRNCQCQANLMLRVPEVKRVMEEKPEPRLDKVFKVTGDIIQTCQDIINCSSCQISHADLVCIMAVFQHTDKCFDYIAKSHMANAFIKVSVGEYQVSLINDLMVRRMLDIDLVQKARELLFALSSVGQQLLVSKPGASRLIKINLDYLQEAVHGFEVYLRSITGSFNENLSI